MSLDVEVAERSSRWATDQIEEMRELDARLAAFVRSRDTACSGGFEENCVIIDDVSMITAIASGVSCRAVKANAG